MRRERHCDGLRRFGREVEAMKSLKPRPDAHKLLPERCQIPGKEAPASRTALLSTVSSLPPHSRYCTNNSSVTFSSASVDGLSADHL